MDDLTTILEDQMRYLSALHEIICDSCDADSVRLALSALTASPAGINYLKNNPIKV